MSSLCLHRGAVRLDKLELASYTPPPATETYCPVAHLQLVNTVQTALGERGLSVTSEDHAIGNGGRRYFGILNLASSGDYNLTVGMRNSYDRQLAAGITIGSRVFVCDNLAFVGDVSFRRKHTSRIMDDLPVLVEGIMDQVDGMADYQDALFARYRRTRLDDEQAERYILDLYREGTIPAKSLPAVVNQWDRPAHEDFQEPTYWRLFNAITEVAKTWPAERMVQRTRRANDFLAHELGVLCIGA